MTSRRYPDYDWDAFYQQARALVVEGLDCRQLVIEAGLSKHLHYASTSLKSRCPTPSHEDVHPSCSVFAQRWVCHGCGAKGDVFDLLGHIHEQGLFKEQLKLGLERLGYHFDLLQAEFLTQSRAAQQTKQPLSFKPPLPQPSSKPLPPLKQAPRYQEPHPQASLIWSFALDGLMLERSAQLYVYARGISPQLATAHACIIKRQTLP
jgi:DNA primase